MENNYEMTQEMKEKLEELKAKMIQEKELSPGELDDVTGGVWDGTGMPSEEDALEMILTAYRNIGFNVAREFALQIGFRKEVVDGISQEIASQGENVWKETDYESWLREMVWRQYHS